jgi:hypothetical protein
LTYDSASFVLTVKNPCIDPDFVTITAPTMLNLSYIIGTVGKSFAVHESSTIVAAPATLALCGEISY